MDHPVVDTQTVAKWLLKVHHTVRPKKTSVLPVALPEKRRGGVIFCKLFLFSVFMQFS